MIPVRLRNISFGLLGLLTLAMAAATAVERLGGRDMAMRLFYHSPLMVGLWTVMLVCSIAYVMRRRSSMSLPVVGLHLSFAVILVGAAVTFFFGKQGKIVLHEEDAPLSVFSLDSGGDSEFPFEISLVSSEVRYYPGTSSAMDYVSDIEIRKDSVVERHSVAMNRILSVDGYRFYQTALGPDTSTLSVAYDPVGIGVSYAGYCMLFISMTAFFFSSRSRFRRLVRRLVVVALFLVPSLAATAHDSPAALPKTFQVPLADSFGKLYAYWGGRVVPLQTVARDFCMKVYGGASYRGLSAEQVLAGWIFYYDDWKNEPMIKVKGDEVRELLGIEGKYASLSDFYRGGMYRLGDISDRISDRNLLSADEKVGLITRICTGRGIRIFPYRAEGAAMEWFSWVDPLPAGMVGEDADFVATCMETVARDIAHGRFNKANEMFGRIRECQIRLAGPGNLPSDFRFGSECMYNRLSSPWLPAALAFVGAALGLVFRRRVRLMAGYAALLFLYLTLLLGLRWIVGGHVPVSNGFETMQTMAWLALAFTLVPVGRLSLLRPLGFIVAGLALLVAAMGESNPTVSSLMPVLSSPLLSLHVLLVMTSYTLFAMMMLDSVLAFLSGKDSVKAARLADLSAVLLYPAVFTLGAGIFIGAVWANQSWGRYWGWDPKETWAFITFIVYSFPLHATSFPAFRRPRVVNAYFFFAFMAVLMTYFGVNYFLAGLHSYAAG